MLAAAGVLMFTFDAPTASEPRSFGYTSLPPQAAAAPPASTITTTPAPVTATTVAPTTTSVPPPVEPEAVVAETVPPSGCEAAVERVAGRAGVPAGWTIECDPRDTGHRGEAYLREDRIVVYWNESAHEYDLTVAHELGHAWDNYQIQSEAPGAPAARAAREAWLGRPMTDDEWRGWYRLFGERYAEHLAATWGYPGAGH